MADKYQVNGYPGMAFRIHGPARQWDPVMTVVTDGYGGEYEFDTGEGEWVDDPLRAVVIAVGDDHKLTVDVGNMVALDEEDYCAALNAARSAALATDESTSGASKEQP